MFKSRTIPKLLFIFISLLIYHDIALAALPGNWQKSVVMIEKRMASKDSAFSFVPHGTGFIFKDTIGYVLITNRHILTGRDTIFIRYNLADFSAQRDTVRYFRSPCPLKGKDGAVLWKAHPNEALDVAAVRLVWPGRAVDIAFFEDKWLRPVEILDVGEDVYFFGFPLMILGLQGKGDFPILRSGVVSYIITQPTYIAGEVMDSGTFLIDGFSFPGNSGSPVIIRASATKPAALIGIIYGHLNSSNDYTIQPDSFPLRLDPGDSITVRPPVLHFTAQENAGLAKGVSAGMIRQVLDLIK